MAATYSISLSRLVFVSLLWLEQAEANSFKPNCTLPPKGTNYVSASNTRSTVTILWNCLSIIILCTWSIQHLNVPVSRPSPPKKIQKVKWAMVELLPKIKWMIFTVFVPEYLMGKALNEFATARNGLTYYIPHDELVPVSEADYEKPEDLEWEEIHVRMANMGYFVVDFEHELSVENRKVPLPFETETKNAQKILEAKFSGIDMERIKMNLTRLKHSYWALDNYQLHHALRRGIIDLPKVSATQLQKLDRGDTLSKALAFIQIAYLIVQLIARKLANLPSAQLEIGALSFAIASVITYGLYWNSPQGVESIHIIQAKRIPTDEDVASLGRTGPLYLWLSQPTETKLKTEFDLSPLPNHSIPIIYGRWLPERISDTFGSNDEAIILGLGAIFGGVVFGAIHCLAWNFDFPTHGERLAWRICSLITTALPLLSGPWLGLWIRANPFAEGTPKTSKRLRHVVGFIWAVVFLTPYILARLFLTVELFRTLFFLPPEAFIDTWSGSFPHFG